MRYTVTEFDALPRDDAVALLRTVCTSKAWADRVAAARPYGTVAALLETAAAAVQQLSEADLDAALAGHPRIGDRSSSAASRLEQATVATADAQLRADLADGNRAYEERFGHVYLVRAAGRSAAELLDILRRRLTNDPATERGEVRAALADINRLRLERLIVDPGSSTLSTHVLDATVGAPAAGVTVILTAQEGVLATGVTDGDGRIAALSPQPLSAGIYTLTFATGDYFAARGTETFYPEVAVTFRIPQGSSHFHVPLLLSPYSYSTYRGS